MNVQKKLKIVEDWFACVNYGSDAVYVELKLKERKKRA